MWMVPVTKQVLGTVHRFDEIEYQNRLLLQKMSALMAAGSVVDPTEGTWEFQPGVRLNKNQMPVIDHAVSHDPPMPQPLLTTTSPPLDDVLDPAHICTSPLLPPAIATLPPALMPAPVASPPEMSMVPPTSVCAGPQR